MAVYIAFVQHLSAIEITELQFAAGALNSPKSVEASTHAHRICIRIRIMRIICIQRMRAYTQTNT